MHAYLPRLFFWRMAMKTSERAESGSIKMGKLTCKCFQRNLCIIVKGLMPNTYVLVLRLMDWILASMRALKAEKGRSEGHAGLRRIVHTYPI